MSKPTIVFMTLILGTTLYGQGVTSGAFNQYMADAPASTSIGLSTPINANGITDALFQLNIQAFPVVGPVALVFRRSGNLGTSIDINAVNTFGVQFDIKDVGNNGYLDQTLLDGFTNPNASNMTDATGSFNTIAIQPSCVQQANIPTCTNMAAYAQFEIASQVILTDQTAAPFNVNSTAAILGSFEDGYKKFPIAQASPDAFGTFNFKNGFNFNFYGVNYTQAFVSTNGYISFGAGTTTFPNPTVNGIRTGLPRIMCFYTDLSPENPSYAPTSRIYAQQFRDSSGVTKVKFVFANLAEFANATGPHGGEIVITENDDIATYVHGYNAFPSINTGVGITPGYGVDPNVAGFGQDLSARMGTLHARGPGKSAFEFFDHGPGGTVLPSNPLDLAGVGNNPSHPIGRGIVFLKNTALTSTAPGNSGYIIQ